MKNGLNRNESDRESPKLGKVEINEFVKERGGDLKLKRKGWNGGGEEGVAFIPLDCLSTRTVIISRSELIHRSKLFSWLKITLQMVSVSRS